MSKSNFNVFLRCTIWLALVVAIGAPTELSAFQPGANQDDINQQPQPSRPNSPFRTAQDATRAAQDATQFPPEQSNVVNEDFAGWREAGDDQQELSNTLRANWVMAGEFGALTGKIAGIEGADLGNMVVTLLNEGRVVMTAYPEEDATFTFSNVRQGAYSIVGWGDNGFFAFSINILRYSEDAPDTVPVELNVTAVPNKTTINTDWIQYFSSAVEFRIYGRYESGEGEDDPARLYGFEGLSTFFPAAIPATSLAHQPVSYSPNGMLIGRVHQITSRSGRPVDLRNTRVMLLKEDDVFAATSTDVYGVFGFSDIPEGDYACVAVGADGMGCIGISPRKNPDVTPTLKIGDDEDGELLELYDGNYPIDFTMVASESIGWLNHKASEVAYQRIVSRPLPPPPVDPPFNKCCYPFLNRPKRTNFIQRFNNTFSGLIYDDDGQRDKAFNQPGGTLRPGGYRGGN